MAVDGLAAGCAAQGFRGSEFRDTVDVLCVAMVLAGRLFAGLEVAVQETTLKAEFS